MKIYNRRSFAAGLLSLALAMACGVVLLTTGFAAKWLIALALLLAAGGFDLWWSLSRDARLPRADERDEAVSRKSAWLAYRIVANGCWIAGIGGHGPLRRHPGPGRPGGDCHLDAGGHRRLPGPAGGQCLL